MIQNPTSVVTLVCIGGCTGHHDGTQAEDEDGEEKSKRSHEYVLWECLEVKPLKLLHCTSLMGPFKSHKAMPIFLSSPLLPPEIIAQWPPLRSRLTSHTHTKDWCKIHIFFTISYAFLWQPAGTEARWNFMLQLYRYFTYWPRNLLKILKLTFFEAIFIFYHIS